MKSRISSLAGVLAGLLMLLGTISPVSAASSSSLSSGTALKVSPVVSNLVIDAGKSQTQTIYVQNVTNSTVTLQVLINDFTASDNESGQPALLLDPNQSAPSHSLKKLIKPLPNITLSPGERKSVDVVIAVPKGAAAGGYYGAVRFAPAASRDNTSVTLVGSVASLVLVRVPGHIKEDLKLLSLDVRQVDPKRGTESAPSVIFTDNANLVAAVRIQNNGDVQEQPFGKALLMQNGKQIASYELNDTTPRGNVLPGSTRKFTIKLDKVGWFGKYTLVGNFSYPHSDQLLSATTTFYVVPLGIILLALAVALVVLFFIFVFPRLLRSYNRRIIAGSRRR